MWRQIRNGNSMRISAVIPTTVLLCFFSLALARASGHRKCDYDKEKVYPCNKKIGRRVQVRMLLPGSDVDCPVVLKKEVPCELFDKEIQIKLRIPQAEPQTNGRKTKCKYFTKDEGVCDQATKTRTTTLALAKGSSPNCQPIKLVTNPCRAIKMKLNVHSLPAPKKGEHYDCKYVDEKVLPCDNETKTRNVTMTLAKGSPVVCERRKVDIRPCEGNTTEKSATKPSKHVHAKQSTKCEYTAINRTSCDNATHKVMVTKKLIKGPKTCKKFKVEKQPCKGNATEKPATKPSKHVHAKQSTKCEYTAINRTSCDNTTHKVMVTQKLIKGPKTCKKFKVEKQPCKVTQKRKRLLKRKKCRYSVANKTECDNVTHKFFVTFKLKAGDKSFCNETKILAKSCRAPKRKHALKKKKLLLEKVTKIGKCEYITTNSTSCDYLTNERNVTLKLIKGDKSACKPTKIESRWCTASEYEKLRRKVVHLIRRTAKRHGCRYVPVNRTRCDNATNEQTITMKLTEGDLTYCTRMEVITRSCSATGEPKVSHTKRYMRLFKDELERYKCRYAAVNRTDCDNATNQQNITLRLKKGNSDVCKMTKVVTRSCSGGDQKDTSLYGKMLQEAYENLKHHKCEYTTVSQTPCSNLTHNRLVTLKLTKGDRSYCDKEKEVLRECTDHQSPNHSEKLISKSNCQYTTVNQTSCDKKTNKRTVTMKLKKGSSHTCTKVRVLTETCKA